MAEYRHRRRQDQGQRRRAAGNQLTITEARDTSDGSYQYSTRKSGLGFTNGLVVPEKKAASDATTAQSNTAVATTIDSANGGVLLQGEGSAFVQGSQIDAKKDLTITAGTVVVTGATNYESSSSAQTRKNSNLGTETGWRDLGKGIGEKNTDTSTRQATSVAETTLQGANVNLTATGPDGQGGTLYLAGTRIDTPGTLSLNADQLILATQTTQVDVSETRQGRDLMWQKAQGEGSSDQSTHYVQMNAGQIATDVRSVQAGLGAKDSIAALAQQPGMGWVNQITSDPKLQGQVDWVKVEEAHTKWQYDQQGLTPEGAAIVTLVASYLSFGAASTLGASAGAAVGGGVTGTVVAGAVTAGVTALASQAAVAVINNKGDLGAALDDLGSSASVKNLATAIVTGGVLGALNLNPTGLPTAQGGAQEFMTQLGQNLQAGAAKALIGTAINVGSLESNLKANLKNALLDTASAQSAYSIGKTFPVGELSNYVAHAIAGCVVGATRSNGGSGCGSGAVGAVVGEAAALSYNAGRDVLKEGLNPDTVAFASMLGGISAAAVGGDPNIGAAAAENAAANNFAGAVARGVAACLEVSLCRAGVLTAAMAVSISAEIERTRVANPGMSDRAVETLAVSTVLAQATVDGVRSAYDWFASAPQVVVDPSSGGYGAGDARPVTGPTFIPSPAQAVQEFGSPPLNSPSALQDWLGNVLEGVPSDQAQLWAQDFIRTLPATQQQSLGDFILLSIADNSVAGKGRERLVTTELKNQYPNASVQNEQYLRDKNGSIAIDPATGTGRRLDHVVIQGGAVIDVVETTSLTAKKEAQIRHEENTGRAGGTFVIDRTTGNLVEVPSVSRIMRRP